MLLMDIELQCCYGRIEVLDGREPQSFVVLEEVVVERNSPLKMSNDNDNCPIGPNRHNSLI